MSICFLKDLRANLEKQPIQHEHMRRKPKPFLLYSLQTTTGKCMTGFTFFFCSTLRNVAHSKSSRTSCGSQHLLLIRREATRSQHTSSFQIFPLTCKLYHALSLKAKLVHQCWQSQDRPRLNQTINLIFWY